MVRIILLVVKVEPDARKFRFFFRFLPTVFPGRRLPGRRRVQAVRTGAGRQDHLRADPGHGGQVLQHPNAGGVKRMRTSLHKKIRKIKIGPVWKLQKERWVCFAYHF